MIAPGFGTWDDVASRCFSVAKEEGADLMSTCINYELDERFIVFRRADGTLTRKLSLTGLAKLEGEGKAIDANLIIRAAMKPDDSLPPALCGAIARLIELRA